jgi:hypothetical protein
MKSSTWEEWCGKKVRLKDQPTGPIGVVESPAHGMPGWWLVAWPDGSRKRYPPRALTVVPEGEVPDDWPGVP